ncbi:MAG TPA: glycosyltransferase family 9 protein [Blastocatellia bacterium]
MIRLRSIGDTVLMTPCLAALKSWRPDLHITVLLEETAAPLLESHHLVDRVIVCPKNTTAKVGLIREVRRSHFDIAFNMHGGTTGTIIASLSGTSYTAGYAGFRYSRLLSQRAPDPDVVLGKKQIHSVEQQLALLSWTGVPWPSSTELSLPVSASARESVSAQLRSAGMESIDSATYAIISPSASIPSKRWPAANFAMIAEHLYDFWRIKSVVIAATGEEETAQGVAIASNGNAQVVGSLSLSELVALIARAKLFVGNDSGPMHIAGAMKIPLVAIFGSSNPDVWRPWTQGACKVCGAGQVFSPEAAAGPSRQSSQQSNRHSAAHVDPAEQAGFPISTISIDSIITAVDEVMEESLSAT